MDKLTFERLSQFSPRMEHLPPESNISTPFWEDLYQLFKERLLTEMRPTQGGDDA